MPVSDVDGVLYCFTSARSANKNNRRAVRLHDEPVEKVKYSMKVSDYSLCCINNYGDL